MEIKRKLIPQVKNIIPVASGKGGVGKSTVSANIALALAKGGSKVGLMDADVYGPSIPHLLGIKGRPATFEEGGQPRIVPLEKDGIKLMSMGFLIEEGRAAIWRGPMLHGMMQQFIRNVSWGELDYLVIDLPPTTGDVPLSLSQLFPLTGAVIVCTPQDVALIDAVRALNMFRQLRVPILGLVENMSHFDCPHCGVSTRAAYDAAPIPSSAFGPCLTAAVALLTGAYHISRRKTRRLLFERFGISVSLGARWS